LSRDGLRPGGACLPPFPLFSFLPCREARTPVVFDETRIHHLDPLVPPHASPPAASVRQRRRRGAVARPQAQPDTRTTSFSLPRAPRWAPAVRVRILPVVSTTASATARRRLAARLQPNASARWPRNPTPRRQAVLALRNWRATSRCRSANRDAITIPRSSPRHRRPRKNPHVPNDMAGRAGATTWSPALNLRSRSRAEDGADRSAGGGEHGRSEAGGERHNHLAGREAELPGHLRRAVVRSACVALSSEGVRQQVTYSASIRASSCPRCRG